MRLRVGCDAMWIILLIFFIYLFYLFFTLTENGEKEKSTGTGTYLLAGIVLIIQLFCWQQPLLLPSVHRSAPPHLPLLPLPLSGWNEGNNNSSITREIIGTTPDSPPKTSYTVLQ